MLPESAPPPIASDALKANLRETSGEVVISSSYAPLQEIVSRFQGLSVKLQALLYEISHPFRNWKLIIPELRAFTLKNLNHYREHEQGPEAFTLFTGIFFEALRESSKNEKLVLKIMEALLAYCDKMIQTMDVEAMFVYEQAFSQFFSRLNDLDTMEPQVMMAMVQGHHPVRKIAIRMIELRRRQPERPFSLRALALLMRAILFRNYEYWMSEEDPLPWFEKQCGDACREWTGLEFLEAISHRRIRDHQAILETVELEGDCLAGLETVVTLPSHMDIVRFYREIPAKMVADSTGETEAHFVENRKLLFLFRIMDTKGLSLIHEETLREINRSLVQLIRKQTFEEIEQFFITTFQLLKANVRRYPHTSLQCIQVIGNEVFKRGNSRLVEAFLWEAVRFGFQYANVRGVDEDWQPIANPAHLTNIRVWLNLIQQEPKWCSTLFSALIINIRLSGTCVRDTDLFQRDITDLLNHPIGPIYNLAKQFTKLMPVFFNEIGAEGELRDVSTELDEIHKRQDLLIHFLRKQAHVESNNLIVGFIEAIFAFWITLDTSYLLEYLPVEVLRQIEVTGTFVDEQHLLATRIRNELRFTRMDHILAWTDEEREQFLDLQKDVSHEERRAFFAPGQDVQASPSQVQSESARGRNPAPACHPVRVSGTGPSARRPRGDDPVRCLEALLDELEHLQEIILSQEKFEPREEIYYKRHIAVDIPSVYGRYSERKFDALGLTFRLENLANVYLERLFQYGQSLLYHPGDLYSHPQVPAPFFEGPADRRYQQPPTRHLHQSCWPPRSVSNGFPIPSILISCAAFPKGSRMLFMPITPIFIRITCQSLSPQIGQGKSADNYRSALGRGGYFVIPYSGFPRSFFRDLIATTFGLQHLDNFISRLCTPWKRRRTFSMKRPLIC